MDKEINGPGKLLGYRAMNQKLRAEYSIHVPLHLAHNLMGDYSRTSSPCTQFDA